MVALEKGLRPTMRLNISACLKPDLVTALGFMQVRTLMSEIQSSLRNTGHEILESLL